jgi:formylglycine-generating enzyme required for sulfatase activity
LIPGGEFIMGSEAQRDASPPHAVTVSPFYMDRYEITQGAYERVIGKNPSRRKGERNPVERVRWTDALKFCNARSIEEGLAPCYDLETWTCDFSAEGYRLPTEAEWEYACRAGTAGDYYFDGTAEQLDTHAWFRDNARRKHHPVGHKQPNAFGLYDMAGNVREWCNDWYAVDAYSEADATDPRGPATGEKTVLRGGAFSASAESCTSWTRYCDEPGFTDACVASDDYGFRCVRRVK